MCYAIAYRAGGAGCCLPLQANPVDEYNVVRQDQNVTLAFPIISFAVLCAARHAARQFRLGARSATCRAECRLGVVLLRHGVPFRVQDGGECKIRTCETRYRFCRFQNDWPRPLAELAALQSHYSIVTGLCKYRRSYNPEKQATHFGCVTRLSVASYEGVLDGTDHDGNNGLEYCENCG